MGQVYKMLYFILEYGTTKKMLPCVLENRAVIKNVISRT